MKRTDKPKKRISVSSAKGKGRGLQQYVCQKIADLTGFEWGSAGSDKPIESRSMGASGCDVRMESHVRRVFPFSVECKRQENWSVPAWIEQAKQNQVAGTDWLLVCRRSHSEPIIVMDAERFFVLLGRKLRMQKAIEEFAEKDKKNE
jgi:hypothetical protein